MIVLSFKIDCTQYQDLYNDTLSITWDSHENLIEFSFEDSNENFVTLINMISDKSKSDIVVNVLHDNNIIRYYTMQLLPIKYHQSPLQLDTIFPSIINATFKILKSEVNFVDSADE